MVRLLGNKPAGRKANNVPKIDRRVSHPFPDPTHDFVQTEIVNVIRGYQRKPDLAIIF
jgi:hypothetical protein